MQDKTYEQVTGRIIQALEKGVVPWKKPWSTLTPQNIKGRPYTGINRLLLNLTEYPYPIYLSMKQANELGGYVKKGERAHLAVFWKIINVPEKTDIGEQKVKYVPFLRYYNVFNIDQTTVPISAVKNVQIRTDEELESTDPVRNARELVASTTDVPEIVFNAAKACYSPALDKIMLPHRNLFKSDEEFYTTEFHELVHSTGHATRLNRKGIQEVRFGSEEYSKEELIAEIGACFLSNMCGMAGVFENSAAYIQGWIKAIKNDSRMVVHAAGSAEKAVQYLIGERNREF
jgi:antirestriction protein ArdC